MYVFRPSSNSVLSYHNSVSPTTRRICRLHGLRCYFHGERSFYLHPVGPPLYLNHSFALFGLQAYWNTERSFCLLCLPSHDSYHNHDSHHENQGELVAEISCWLIIQNVNDKNLLQSTVYSTLNVNKTF